MGVDATGPVRGAGPGSAPQDRRRPAPAIDALRLVPRRCAPHRILDGPDRQTLGHDRLGQRLLVAPVGGAQQGPGVARTELALGHQPLDARGQLEAAAGCW